MKPKSLQGGAWWQRVRERCCGVPPEVRLTPLGHNFDEYPVVEQPVVEVNPAGLSEREEFIQSVREMGLHNVDEAAQAWDLIDSAALTPLVSRQEAALDLFMHMPSTMSQLEGAGTQGGSPAWVGLPPWVAMQQPARQTAVPQGVVVAAQEV